MHRYRRPTRTGGGVEVLVVNLVHPRIVAHVDEQDREVDDVLELGACGAKDRADVLDYRPRLCTYVETRRSVRCQRNALMRVVGPPAGDAGYVDEPPGTTSVRIVGKGSGAVG